MIDFQLTKLCLHTFKDDQPFPNLDTASLSNSALSEKIFGSDLVWAQCEEGWITVQIFGSLWAQGLEVHLWGYFRGTNLDITNIKNLDLTKKKKKIGKNLLKLGMQLN